MNRTIHSQILCPPTVNGNAVPSDGQTKSRNKAYIEEQRSLGQLDAMKRHREVTAPDVLPQTGHALQVAYYSSVHFTNMNGEIKPDQELDAPVELTGMDQAGFTKPVVGVRITAEQSWEASGVALGHLLHSISLAPGEITKVAVVDWNRREAGMRNELTDQKDTISATNNQVSAHNDVTNSGPGSSGIRGRVSRCGPNVYQGNFHVAYFPKSFKY